MGCLASPREGPQVVPPEDPFRAAPLGRYPTGPGLRANLQYLGQVVATALMYG